MIGTTILFFPLVKHSKIVDVICDFQPEKRNPVRLQSGQVFAISTAWIIWLAEGSNGNHESISNVERHLWSFTGVLNAHPDQYSEEKFQEYLNYSR